MYKNVQYCAGNVYFYTLVSYNNAMTSSQLKQFRVERGLTQYEMAKRIGISRITLRKYESLKKDEKIPIMIAFSCTCLALGLKQFGAWGAE